VNWHTKRGSQDKIFGRQFGSMQGGFSTPVGGSLLITITKGALTKAWDGPKFPMDVFLKTLWGKVVTKKKKKKNKFKGGRGRHGGGNSTVVVAHEKNSESFWKINQSGRWDGVPWSEKKKNPDGGVMGGPRG